MSGIPGESSGGEIPTHQSEVPVSSDGSNFVLDVQEVGDRSAIVTIRQVDGKQVRYLMPARSFFDDFTPRDSGSELESR